MDSVAYGGARVALLRNPVNGSFQVYHSLSSDSSIDDGQEEWVMNTLPGCVNYREGHGKS